MCLTGWACEWTSFFIEWLDNKLAFSLGDFQMSISRHFSETLCLQRRTTSSSTWNYFPQSFRFWEKGWGRWWNVDFLIISHLSLWYCTTILACACCPYVWKPLVQFLRITNSWSPEVLARGEVKVCLCLKVGSLREDGHSNLHTGKHDGVGLIIVPYTEFSNSLPIFFFF